MQHFKLIIQGTIDQNLAGKEYSYGGFFTTRFVSADDLTIASELAFKSVMGELLKLWPNFPPSGVTLTVDSVDELVAAPNPPIEVKGFTWYPREDAAPPSLLARIIAWFLVR